MWPWLWNKGKQKRVCIIKSFCQSSNSISWERQNCKTLVQNPLNVYKPFVYKAKNTLLIFVYVVFPREFERNKYEQKHVSTNILKPSRQNIKSVEFLLWQKIAGFLKEDDLTPLEWKEGVKNKPYRKTWNIFFLLQ